MMDREKTGLISSRNEAAIWCRVSTQDQREISLDSQEIAVRKALEARGFVIPVANVIKVDWTSLDLKGCPQFQVLLRMIREGKVNAVGIFDRDRLQAKGLERLVFLSECEENNVEVVTVQGVPMMDGGEGQVLEMVLALGKERSVLRAQQGSRDGMRDRARLKGLPPSPGPFYGYRWDKLIERYVPTQHHEDAAEIWRLGLSGLPISQIAEQLTQRGIETPGGRQGWWPYSVRHILKNRSYAGVVEALKTEAVEPKQRSARTYGKSGRRMRPEDERIRLEGLVERPIITEPEFEWMQERLRNNKRMASKNTKLRFYLLKGMVRCADCGRTYGGSTFNRNGKFYSYYTCGGRSNPKPNLERCESRTFKAFDLEDAVFSMVSDFLRGRGEYEAELRRRRKFTEETEGSLRRELVNLDRQRRDTLEAEAKAFRIATHSDLTPEVFEQEVGLIRTRLKWIDEQSSRIESQLSDLLRYRLDPEAVRLLRKRLESRLTQANNDDRRFILEALGATVTVQQNGNWELELQVPLAATATAERNFQVVNNGAESNSPSNQD